MTILLGRIAFTECKDAAYCYRSSVVCVFVSPLDTNMNPTKTGDPIKVPYGLWTGVVSVNHLLDGAQIPWGGIGNFWCWHQRRCGLS